MRYVSTVMLLFLMCTALIADDNWKTKRCTEPVDIVFKAADRAAAMHYKIELSDPARRIIRFKVGATAWSYGYIVVLAVDSGPNNSSVITAFLERKGGKVVSWGSGKSEVQRVYAAIDEELVRLKASEKQP